MTDFSFLAALPSINVEVGLLIMAMVVLFLDVYLPESKHRNIAYVSFFGLIALSALPLVSQPDGNLYWGGMIRHDVLAQIFKVMITAAGAITCMIAVDTKDLGARGEFYLIIIVSTLGACLVAASADLIMVYIALETISIPLYILATFKRDDMRSSESGMKYFLFGSFSSGIMLYGFSLLYGFTAETNLYSIAEFLGGGAFDTNAIPVLGALVLVVVGFGFKISAAPFHFWTPDVYEGAPTPVTAFVSVASKAASMALLTRFFVAVFPVTLIVGGGNDSILLGAADGGAGDGDDDARECIGALAAEHQAVAGVLVGGAGRLHVDWCGGDSKRDGNRDCVNCVLHVHVHVHELAGVRGDYHLQRAERHGANRGLCRA